MHLYVVLPARVGSTRLERKMLARIGGETVIRMAAMRAQEGLNRSLVQGSVTVATDSEEIAEAVGGLAKVALTPADCRSGTDRMAAVAASQGWPDGAIAVNVQPDMPLLDPDHLAGFLRMASKGGAWDMLTAFAELMLVEMTTTTFERRRVLSHVGLYAYSVAALKRFASLPSSPLEISMRLEQLRAVENGFMIAYHALPVMPIEINTPEDLAQAQNFAECLA